MSRKLATAIEDASAFIRRYVVLTDEQLIAVSLWVLHTYALDAAEITPYLAITSAEKESGKSILLDLLAAIAHEPWRAVKPSAAVTFRMIERDCPTLLVDEVDTIWGPKNTEDEALRAILNAGFRRQGSTVPRCDGPSMKLKDFSTFCPKALAGIGDLPDTIAGRSIPIRMVKKRRTDEVERCNIRKVQPIADAVRESIAEAVVAIVADLADTVPELPEELSDRAQDAWEPLLAIADLAGGVWPERARAAAVFLAAGRLEEPPIGTRLLSDIRDILLARIDDVAKIATTELIEELVEIDDAPWGDWGGKPITSRRIAGILKPYNIHPHKDRGFRGYYLADFTDTWQRYLPDPATSATRATA